MEAAVDALADVDLPQLGVEQLQLLGASLAVQGDRIAGLRSQVLAEVDARTGGQVPERPGADRYAPTHAWWRDTARTSGADAAAQVRIASALRALPEVAAAVVDGRITPTTARLLARLVGPMDPQALLDCQQDLLDVVEGLAPDAVARQVAHWLATFCEPALDDADDQAERRRRLTLSDQHDGSHSGMFRLPDGDAEVVRTVLEALSRPTSRADERSAAQRRADALVEVFDLARRHADLPDTGGARAHVSLVVPADWLTRHRPPPLSPAALRACSGPGTTPGQALSPPVPLGGRTAVPPAGSVSRPTPPAPAPAPAPGPGPGAGAERKVGAAIGVESSPVRCAAAAWTGPQTRARVEAYLCDCRLSRVVLDLVGQVLSLAALGDTVPGPLRRALVSRDQHCVARGCTRPPAFCDAHHLTPRADGGRSTLHNLVLLCRRHHVLWHRDRLHLHDLRVPWLSAEGHHRPGVPAHPSLRSPAPP